MFGSQTSFLFWLLQPSPTPGGEPRQNHSWELMFPGKPRMVIQLLKCCALRKRKIWALNDTSTFVPEQERSWLSSYSHCLRMLWGLLSHYCATTGGIPRKKITRFTYYMLNFMSWLQCVWRALISSPVFHSAWSCKEGMWQCFWWVDPVENNFITYCTVQGQ